MTVVLDAQVAARQVSMSLEVPTGQVLALVGRNGSGKSTALGLIAGLVVPDAGRASVGERALFAVGSGDHEPDGRRGHVVVPPHRRGIALLAQDPLLFGHLSVLDNVAFGPRSRGAGRRESRVAARRWLTEVGAEDLADRRPAQLSGGQAQRVALARSLAAEPEVLLLDEPLAALDVAVAVEVRRTLRRVLRGRTAVLATHDVLDVLLLADRVAVLEGGQVVEEGPVDEVTRRPRSEFAAQIFGWNLLRGVAVDEEALRTDLGATVRGVAQVPLEPGTRAVAVFRPASVSVHRAPAEGSPRNVFTGAITGLEPHAHLIRVRVGDLSADVTADAAAELDLAVGAPVHLAVKAMEVALYPQ